MNSVLENCTLAGDLTGKFAVCVPLRMLFLDCLQTIAFYLFSFSNGVSRACQLDPVLSLRVFFFFFCPCCFLSSQSWRRKKGSGDPATPISLETDEAASLSPPSLPSSPPSSSSPPLMTSLCSAVTSRARGNFSS